VSPSHLAKMQAGRQAALEARRAAQLSGDARAQAEWLERHQRAYRELLEQRKGKEDWQI